MNTLARFSIVKMQLLAWIAALMWGIAVNASAFSLWPNNLPKQPSLYIIEAYLDWAPESTKILDRITIKIGDRERVLLVTRYGQPGEIGLDLHLSRAMAQPYSIRGSEEDLQRLRGAPKGTRIQGKFVAYMDGPPWLLVSELTIGDEPEKSSS